MSDRDGLDSPLAQAIAKARDDSGDNVPAGINFLNNASWVLCAGRSNETAPLELLKDFRAHLDRRIGELETRQPDPRTTPCNGNPCTLAEHSHAIHPSVPPAQERHPFLRYPVGRFRNPSDDIGKCWFVTNHHYCGLPTDADVHRMPSTAEMKQGPEQCPHEHVSIYVTAGRYAAPKAYWSCENCGADFAPRKDLTVSVSPEQLRTVAMEIARASHGVERDCLARTCFVQQCEWDHCAGCDDFEAVVIMIVAILERRLGMTKDQNDVN